MQNVGNYIKETMHKTIKCMFVYIQLGLHYGLFLMYLPERGGNPHVSECHCHDEEQESM